MKQTGSIKCGSGSNQGSTEVYAGPLSGGDFVVMLLNGRGDVDCSDVAVDLVQTLNVSRGLQLNCKDLWTQKDCGPLVAGIDNFTVSVVPTSSATVIRLSPTTAVVAGAGKLSDAARLRARAMMQEERYKEIRRSSRHAAAQAAAQRPPSVPPVPPQHVPQTLEPAAPSLAAWPMRGRDSSRAGVTPFKGPSACNLKWHAYNSTTSTVSESTPIVTGGGLVVAASGNLLLAADLETGEEKWNASFSGSTFGTPAALYTAAGVEYVVIGSSDGGVYAFSAASGLQLWRVQTGGPVFSSAASTDTLKGPVLQCCLKAGNTLPSNRESARGHCWVASPPTTLDHLGKGQVMKHPPRFYGGRRNPVSDLARGGSLLLSLSADVRPSDAVIAFVGLPPYGSGRGTICCGK